MRVLGVTDHRFLGGFGTFRDSGMKWHEDGHAIAADETHDERVLARRPHRGRRPPGRGDPRGPAAGAGDLRPVRRLRPPRPHPGPPGRDVRRHPGRRPVLPARPRRAVGHRQGLLGGDVGGAGCATACARCARPATPRPSRAWIPTATCRRSSPPTHLISTRIDGAAYVEQKMAALAEHRTQVEQDGPFFSGGESGHAFWGEEAYRIVRGTPRPGPDGLRDGPVRGPVTVRCVLLALALLVVGAGVARRRGRRPRPLVGAGAGGRRGRSRRWWRVGPRLVDPAARSRVGFVAGVVVGWPSTGPRATSSWRPTPQGYLLLLLALVVVAAAIATLPRPGRVRRREQRARRHLGCPPMSTDAREKAGGRVVVLLLLVLALLLSGGYAAAYAAAGDDVPRGTTVEGVEIGGRPAGRGGRRRSRPGWPTGPTTRSGSRSTARRSGSTPPRPGSRSTTRRRSPPPAAAGPGTPPGCGTTTPAATTSTRSSTSTRPRSTRYVADLADQVGHRAARRRRRVPRHPARGRRSRAPAGRSTPTPPARRSPRRYLAEDAGRADPRPTVEPDIDDADVRRGGRRVRQPRAVGSGHGALRGLPGAAHPATATRRPSAPSPATAGWSRPSTATGSPSWWTSGSAATPRPSTPGSGSSTASPGSSPRDPA